MINQKFNNLVIFSDEKLMNNNSYLIIHNKQAVLIDVANNWNDINIFLKKNNLKLIALILTHGHFDHIIDIEKLSSIPIYINENEKNILDVENKQLVRDFKIDYKKLNIHYFLQDKLNIPEFNFKIFHTPGHTPGGVCIAYENYLFTGDTIFTDSIGRYDLMFSNVKDLIKSIKTIGKVNDNYIIFPGHGRYGEKLKIIKKHNNLLNSIINNDYE